MEVQQFKTTGDLIMLQKLADGRDKWKEVSKMICSIA